MRSARWTVTIRHGSRVERVHRETLNAALSAMESRIDELAPLARRDTVKVGGRRYDPVRQVAVRAEVRGPGSMLRHPRGGVDMRGDGSIEAYSGRWRRSVIACAAEEPVYAALRRALAGRGARPG